MRREPYITPEAKGDIFDAVSYYNDARPNLGYEFLDQVQHALERIRENPGQFPIIEGRTRRVLLRRFPYGMFYAVGEQFEVVLAVIDLRQHPDAWKRRVVPG